MEKKGENGRGGCSRRGKKVYLAVKRGTIREGGKLLQRKVGGGLAISQTVSSDITSKQTKRREQHPRGWQNKT